ncbi:MAG: hypothetical protein AAFY71_28020 [Bacteroidota bacterium]
MMNQWIRAALLCVVFMCYAGLLFPQKSGTIEIPMTSEHWVVTAGKVDFVEYKSTRAVKSAENGFFNIMLKDQVFSTGTIEFDVEMVGNGFPGINFRIGPDTLNSEVFYLRHFGKPDPLRRTSTQYAAVIDGVNLWDLTDEYQAGATILEGKWNHIKLVISKHQLYAYVNDMKQPALKVPMLEGITQTGGISLSGNVIYANMILRPHEIGNLPDVPGIDPSDNDPRFLRTWEVSEPIDLPFGRDVMMGIRFNPGVAIDSSLLNANTKWKGIQAGHRGLVNLTRLYGATDEGQRRIVWLKTTLNSETAQEKLMRLGFRDEVWVFINGSPLHVDKNYYGSAGMKEPRGRCSLENASFEVPLQAGKNEIIIGLSNYFFGWGFMARLEDTAGIKF